MRILIAVAAVAVVLAGCGSDDEPATTAAGTGDTAEAAATDAFGTYEREVTQAEIDEKGEKERPEGWTPPPSGTWGLTLSEGSMIATDPEGGSIAQEASLADGTLTIGRYIGSKGIAFCANDAPASYALEASGDELVLSPEDEGCGDRQAILAGTWVRSSPG